jgi:1-aminocyclopropane-1-carboxylate deaminase/D-cysteine desulfhydrase-like pyridoxal-dependent ACC family enzyme
VGWRPHIEGLPEQLAILADQTAELLGVMNPLGPNDFATLDFGGPMYGVPGPDALEALVLCAQTDALLLDPAYTAKGMAGLISQIRNGAEKESATVVFVHTGGVPALFAYGEEVLAAAVSENKN